MSGLIGVIAQETGRYSVFAASITGLVRPSGSDVSWVLGHNIAENVNQLVEDMYEMDGEWLWILGDDHAFVPTTLERLLAHDVDVVVPLCLQRNPPYRPVVYTGFTDEAPHRFVLNLSEHPDGGLVPIHSAGSGGMLVRRSVFDMMNRPWFESGQLDNHSLGEDLYFCDKAREAGASIFVDLDTTFGHCQTSEIWPVREPDGWTYAFRFTGGMEITLPPSRSWKIAADLAA